MNKRNIAPATMTIFLAVFSTMVNAKQWQGYLNTESLKDSSYGYLSVNGDVESSGKLGLVCVSPDKFKLVLSTKLFTTEKPKTAVIAVDTLTPMELSLTQLGREVVVKSDSSSFWDLVARMSAGANIVIDIGNGNTHRYNLSGFTTAYTKACGWLDTSQQYQAYLSLYR